MSNHHWIELLEDEDLAFLKRFVLASGSLKDIAKVYGISYPTVRLRLDRLIAKIQIFDSPHAMSDFERTVRGLHADCKIDLVTLRTLLAAHHLDLEKNHAPSAPDVIDGDRPRQSGLRTGRKKGEIQDS